MKRLLHLMALFSLTASSQSFSVKNVNDEYFVSSIYNAGISRNNFHEFIRDKNGLYWFQNITEVYSFDGVNWKSYSIRSMNGSTNPFRINDIQSDEYGNIWLATEHGIYVYDQKSEHFVSIRNKFQNLKNIHQGITCFFPGTPGKIIFLSFYQEGFFILDVRSGDARHVLIDKRTFVPITGNPVISDMRENIWGITTDNKGVWLYNTVSNTMRCSWKGELPVFAGERFANPISLTFCDVEQAIWISHTANRYLEKMDWASGKSTFYSFSGNVRVWPDTNVVNRHEVFPVKIDRENNKWVNAGKKFIIRLDKNISRMEYLAHDPEQLPIGDFQLFKPESPIPDDRNNISLWIQGVEKISMIKKRGDLVTHIYSDTTTKTGVLPIDYSNSDGRQNIFFEKGKDGQYFILQQNPGRAKLILFDKDFTVRRVLFNDEWKQYPAYFSREFKGDTLFIAMLRPGLEPLDFRNVIVKDFYVDLHSFEVRELNLSFEERIWRYGYEDSKKVCWLYSNGYLYSFDPARSVLDSIFISKPTAKGSNAANMIKGFNYPSTLHKNSSTFWLNFFPVRELYKINLDARKVDSVFKTCMDAPDCVVPGGIYDIYNFDSSSVYLKSSFLGMLLHTRKNSLVDFSALLSRKLPLEIPLGAGMAGEWMVMAYPSMIYLWNTQNFKQKQLSLGNDFKWRLASFKSRPLINDRGELVFMAANNRGFLVFNPDSSVIRQTPGVVMYTQVRVDNKSLPIDSVINNQGLVLKYNKYNSIQVAFSDYSVFAAEKTNYEYALLKKNDTVWNTINGKPELTFSDLPPGKYKLLLRASNIFGDFSKKINALPITITPAFVQTWGFRFLIFLLLGFVFFGLYLYRLRQLKKLQTIRNNIASDLHDDIGSTLNSISIYSEVAKQQAGANIPALDIIGINSRKIIESMSDIVWTINPENDSFEKIIVRMRSFAHQLLKAKKVEYTFEVDEKLGSYNFPMQVRKNFYLVFKEAITNVVKYSEASRVSIVLYEKNKSIMLRIRDNGKGIPVNAETQGNGLLNMKRRASEIDAQLSIHSFNEGGTAIELTLNNFK